MPRLSQFDAAALAATLGAQHSVISREQALACGLSPKALAHRLRPAGPWQVVVPGVYVAHRGTLSPAERAAAAWAHASRPLAVTGLAALAWHGVDAPPADVTDVLVAPGCKARDVAFIRLHRTTLPPVCAGRDGAVAYAAPARAVADAARQLAGAGDVAALVAAVVARRKATIWLISQQLAAGPVRGSAALRGALQQVARQLQAGAQSDLAELALAAGLPAPDRGPRLYCGKQFLAAPSAWWRGAGVAVVADTWRWHLSAASWGQALARCELMAARGIAVLRVRPDWLAERPGEVAARLAAALARSSGPVPRIRTVPARQRAGAGQRPDGGRSISQ